ncbi:MAG: DUF4337 domain-containing protein [Verrucomicrobia bacterium]|nr:DUF4337 domain-containing protein [Verrucomicrobiota bacterium]NBY36347.1 DUF4337 domain-containing protein [Verrucomicrobiota bacterium]
MSETKKTETPAPAPDAWTKWVALSTTLLAVCAAFATLKGGSFSTKTQLATVSASNKWSYFQSKSLKETARDTESTIIKVIEASATNPEAKAIARKAIDKADDEIKRYKIEKAEIMKEAQFLDAEAAYSQARGGNFGLAIMFLQIAIMLSAISALMKKKSFWIVGLCAGAIGVGFLVYAWPLYEKINPAPVSPVAVKASK